MILTFEKNNLIIDILIARSDNDDVRGSLKTLETSTYQKDVETLKVRISDIGTVFGLAQNDQISTTNKLKEKLGSSSRKEILESSKGPPLTVPVHYHPSETSKHPYQQPLFIPPPIQNLNYNCNQTDPERPPQFDPIPMAYIELFP